MKLITIRKAAAFAGAAVVLTVGVLPVVFSGPAIAVTGACNTYKLTITPTTETGDSAQIVGFYSNPPTGFNVDAYPNLSTVTVASLSGTSSAGSFVGVPDGNGGYKFKSAAGVTLISATALGCDTPTTPPTTTTPVTTTPTTTPPTTTTPVTTPPTTTTPTTTTPVKTTTAPVKMTTKPPVKKTTTKPLVKSATTKPPVKTTTGVNPLPTSGHAGQADTNGQLVAGIATGGLAVALTTAGVFLYRRQGSDA